MAFIRKTGSDRRSLPNKIAKKASTAIEVGDVLISTSGQADVAVASSVNLLGIAMKDVLSTDSDYASTTPVTIEQIDSEAVYIAPVVTGTATAAMIGLYRDLADETGVDVTGTTYNQVKIVGVLNGGTAVEVVFNAEVL